MSDLSIAGPGSPVSLKKFCKEYDSQLKKVTVLVDGTGLGIVKDEPSCIYITPEECSKQAIYYCKEVYKGQIPAYLYRYLSYMFIDNCIFYNNDQELAEAFNKGLITRDHPDYQTVENLILWCETNKEAQQVIGTIQLMAGSLNMARKMNSGIRLYFEHPETSLHPKRQSRMMSLILKIDNEYGFKTIEDDTGKS